VADGDVLVGLLLHQRTRVGQLHAPVPPSDLDSLDEVAEYLPTRPRGWT
jgi:hypothetical protein